jgi:N6-L-threonylcarbamoyladenine synthase
MSLILGIETSCDETAAAVVSSGRRILSSVISSSLAAHKRYHGIIPEIASRAHVESINSVVRQALRDARRKLADIDIVAVTNNPGLIGSLLVGIFFAKGLSFSLGKPLVEVNHIHAHLYPVFLENSRPRLPFVGLVVSGGHTNIFYVPKFNDFRLLGRTQDDAAGEAFDKVARILGLAYPGGPIIDKLSRQGDSRRVKFNCADLKDSFDFSFSGLKTSVLYYIRDKWDKKGVKVADIAASFQKEVVKVLVQKSIAACRRKAVNTLVVGGGVACNSQLRSRLTEECSKRNIKVYFPKPNLCLDNAAMVAGLAHHLYNKRRRMR